LPAEFPPVIPTANDYVALPDIAPDGSIGSIQLLSSRARGLIGFAGRPLLRPVVDGIDLGTPLGERVDGWIPRFRFRAGPVGLTETICAPPESKGFVIVLELENQGDPRVTTLGLEGTWEATTYTLFRGRRLPVVATARQDPWTHSLGMEALAGLPVAAWAVHTVPEVEGPPAQRTDGPVALRLVREFSVGRGDRAVLAFYVGVGAEEDGARATAVDLRRHGWEGLLDRSRAWLRPRLAGGADRLAALYTGNLLFNRFFSCGRTIDTEELVWVTSRSPRYYVSAAFWSRDAFLWSLPGLLLADPGIAREAVVYAFRTQWRNAGMHAQYLDGAIIYPGFELDELAAFPIGLAAYLTATGDASILDERGIRDAVLDYPRRLALRRGACGLYETFLDPSDDPVRHPYLTYDNVLAWRGLLDVAGIFARMERDDDAGAARSNAAALEEAVRMHCVVRGPTGPMYAWAVDGQGAFQLYDDPPGSLLLLPYYGFCRADDPAYVNTVQWIHSSANPWYVSGRFPSPVSAHAPDPWPMAVVNGLLAGRSEGLQWLRDAEMDGGIACETVEAGTGRVKTGGAFATFAGLLAAALARGRSQWER